MTSVDNGLKLPLDGWVDVGDVEPPDARAMALFGVAGVGTDLAVRSGVIGLAGALLVLVVAAGALASGRVTNRRAWPLFLAAPAFGMCLMARTSQWLLPLDVLAVAGLLVLGATLSREGDPSDLTVPGIAGRALHSFVHATLAPAFVLRALPRGHRSSSRAALVRGAVLAIPIVVVVGVLLGSADAVFASFFRVPTSTTDVVVHAVLLGIGIWGMAGLLRVASAAPFEMPLTRRRLLGSVEGATVLAGLVALLGAFAASQVIVAIRGSGYVRRTAGLSYAEYARSGFFQLLAVAVISLAVVMAVRGATDAASSAERRRFLWLGEAAAVLTIVVVATAIRRLHLYEQAYGLTMLRLCSLLVAVWIGAVFVLLALALAGVGGRRSWFVPAATALALLGLFGANVANLESIVVRRNVERFASTDKLDVAYFEQLSDDAVPALASAIRSMRPADATSVRDALCLGPRRASGGFWSYNASKDGAIEARNRLCPSP